MSPGPKRPTRGVVLAVVGSVLAFSLANSSYHRIYRGRPLSGSEPGWIYASAKSFSLFFLERNFGNAYWTSFFGLDHPPLGRYLLGSALYLGLPKDTFALARARGITPEEVTDDGGRLRTDRPAAQILLVARGFVMVVGSFCAVLVFLIGYRALGLFPGALASILFVYHPRVIEYTVLAMMEAILLFWTLLFGFLAMLLFEWIGDDARSRAVQMLSGVLTVCLAMAAGSKLLGGWVGVALGVTTFLLWWRQRGLPDATGRNVTRRLLWVNAVVLGGSVLVFVGMYPSLYPWSHGKTPVDLIRYRAGLVSKQRVARSRPAMDLRLKARFVADHYVTVSALRSERREQGVAVGFNYGVSSFAAGAILLVAGVGFCVFEVWRRRFNVRLLVLATFALTIFVLNTVWVPLSWPRYALPVLPWKALLISPGVLGSLKGAAALLRLVRRSA